MIDLTQFKQMHFIDDLAFRFKRHHARFLADMPNLESYNKKREVINLEVKKASPEFAYLYQEPLLDIHQEKHLFRKMNLLKWKVQKCIDTDMAECWASEAMEVRQQLVNSNARLGFNLAKKQREYWKSPNLDKLLTIASDSMEGMIRAVDYFDYRKGFKFSTYASWAIFNSINRFKEDRDNKFIGSSNSNDDIFAHEPSYTIEKDLENSEKTSIVMNYLSELDDREQDVISRVFGLKGRPHHLRELAKDLHVSKERVRQIKSRGLLKLKKHMEGVYGSI